MSGVCLDALNGAGAPAPDLPTAAGAHGARLVAFDDFRFFNYLTKLEAAGYSTAVVIARESCANDDFGGWASYFSERCWPTWWILGNEMDAYLLDAPSDSSWKMTPSEYASFWSQAAPPIHVRQPQAMLVVGGLVSGQPSYLEELLPLLDPAPDAVDIHPYGKTTEGAEGLLDLYRETVNADDARALLRSYRDVLRRLGMQ